jgi:hypothetical protein
MDAATSAVVRTNSRREMASPSHFDLLGRIAVFLFHLTIVIVPSLTSPPWILEMT